MDNYARVKSTIFSRQEKGDHAIIGVDDSYSSEICTQLSSRSDVIVSPVSVGKVLGRGVFVVDGVLFDASGPTSREVMDLKTLAHLPGSHNWQNIAMAYAAVRPLVKDARDIARVIPTFPGLEHRIESVGSLGNVRFVNDSKATNADAAARALACFDRIYWIAGGKAKDGGIESLTPYFCKIAKTYLIGAAMDAFAATLDGAVPFERSATLESAMRHAAQDALAAGGSAVVLLSPACASFDQFRDFEHRGTEFKRIFKLMADEAGATGAS
jgi:UDP-N-acetylmuramoylalanine--D-glutamate ligase